MSVLAHTIIVRTAEERNQTQMSAAPKALFETAGRRRNTKTHWQEKRGFKVRVEMNVLMQKHLFARRIR